MGSIDSWAVQEINQITDVSTNIQETNQLTKERLQGLCEEITMKMKKYDYYIRLQLEDTIKNYNLCIALCEEKLDLLSSYKEYKTVLATLSSEKKDQEIMVSERDPHE